MALELSLETEKIQEACALVAKTYETYMSMSEPEKKRFQELIDILLPD